MFDNIFAAIEKWMRELLTGMVESNMSTMFTDVNEKTSEIAAQVGRTPQNWNSSVFSMIQNLSESVVVPIAGIIITLVLCYELISMLTERNNLHDVDTWMFFKYFVKAWVAIYLVSNTFTITMAVFDVGQSVVNSASGIINGETAIDVSSLSMQMQAAMATMEIGELVVLALETFLVSFCIYDKIPTERMNGIKSIGFSLEDGSIYSGMFDLMVGGEVQAEVVNHIQHYRESPLVQKAISDMKTLLEKRQASKELEERPNTRQSVREALKNRKKAQEQQPHQEQAKPKKAKKKGEMEL